MKVDTIRCASLAAVLVFGDGAFASEGGGSVYLQGTYGDFAAGVAGEAGIYLRNDLALYDADIGARPLGGVVAAGMDSEVWLNVVKLSWVSDIEILGGTYIAAVAIPYALDVDASARIARENLQVFREGTTNGFGDPFLTPLAISWNQGAHHVIASLGVSVPLGKYDRDEILNLGRNYWAVDPTVSYSYLDTDQVWDISLAAGVLFNTENDDTDYTTGKEFHLDWFAGRYLSQTFGLGLVGYWYEQLSDDDGFIPPFLDDGFRGRGAGIGPALMKSFTLKGTNLTLIGKWIHDLESENRLDGDLFMFSVALQL